MASVLRVRWVDLPQLGAWSKTLESSREATCINTPVSEHLAAAALAIAATAIAARAIAALAIAVLAAAALAIAAIAIGVHGAVGEATERAAGHRVERHVHAT